MGDLLYSTLMLGRNKKIALEEYQTAKGIKEPAAFAVKEKTAELKDVMGDTTGTIHLYLTTPGYLEIEAFCSDPFISFEKKVVTTDEFAAGAMDFQFRILSRRLHNGKNYARITFETSTQKESVEIVVDNRIRVFAGRTGRQKLFIDLSRDYLKLRMGRLSQEDWQMRSLDKLSRINGSDPEDLYLMLYKAHVCITAGMDMDAKYLIEFVAEQLHKLAQPNPDLSSYFCYVKGLYELTPDSVDRAAGLVKRIYDKSPSWRILWMLFYLDSSYDEDHQKKISLIEEEFFEGGCISPVMYFEALDIFRTEPERIAAANDFELQTLAFGARHDYLNPEVCDQLTRIILALGDLALKERNTGLALKILQKAYDRFPSVDTLKAVCRLLIFRQDRSAEAHEYYRKAIAGFIEIPELYNYFIFSIDQEHYDALPQEIIRYFIENESLLFDYKAYFYANIIKNRMKYPELYKKALPGIDAFAEEQLTKGITDESMAVIYKDILENGRVTEMMKGNLFQIISTRKIITSNRRMKNVMVFHKELSVFQEVPLVKGKAYVKVYSPDARILFKDAAGNLYVNIDYKSKELVEYGEYIDLCIKDVPINKYMFIGDSLPMLREYKNPLEILDFMLDTFGNGQLRSTYEQEILCDMISFFRRHSRDEEVYDKLMEFLKFDLDAPTRGKIVEVMIERAMFREAFEEIREGGAEGVSRESLDKLAHVMAELATEPDDLLTEICEKSFRESGFDPAIFSYLQKYYNDDINVLIEMYRAANVYSLPKTSICERIVRAAVEKKEFPEVPGMVFAEYYEQGEDEELKRKYLEVQADRYVYDGYRKDLSFFEYFGRELLKETEFPVSALVGYLLYMRDRDDIGTRLLRVIQNMIRDLTGRGIMLEEFKDYRKKFALPATLENSLIVSTLHFSEDGDRELMPLTRESLTSGIPTISYTITYSGSSLHCEEAMNEIFPGCFTKYFSLFFGERITCSMEEGSSFTVDYSELHVVSDESRFAKLDEIIRIQASGDRALLKKKAKDYFIRDRLIDKLF
ncbi:MAG: hypothetical protein IKH67_07635 [Lachnospiraceae bacterium]|nr:hypothetical protein [Lachnospiraceae bacterium]